MFQHAVLYLYIVCYQSIMISSCVRSCWIRLPLFLMRFLMRFSTRLVSSPYNLTNLFGYIVLSHPENPFSSGLAPFGILLRQIDRPE